LRRAAARPIVLVTAVLFIAGAASVVAFFPREGQPRQVTQAPVTADYETQFTTAWNQQPRVNLGIPAGVAKVVVVKFNDFMCPSCKAYELAYRPIFEKYENTNPGQVKLILKDWPWNTDCNFNSPPTFPGHQNSCVAAAAVRIARDRGKGEAMAQWLFDQQQKLIEMGNAGSGGPELIKDRLKQLVGAVDYDKEYAAKLADIRRDVADGGALNVRSTPTYYVNGVLVTTQEGSIQPVMLDLAIKIELNKK
jgi:protein-disulfide isomerase